MKQMMSLLAVGLLASTVVLADPPTPKPATRPTTQVVPTNQMFDTLLRKGGQASTVLVPEPSPSPTDSTSGNGAVAPTAPQVNLMREGSYVVDRSARLSRTPDGQQWELTFDADGKAMQDPPMIILPNLKLMTMESTVSSTSRDVRFQVTGMVTEYKSRNYILLEKVVVVPESRQQF